MTADLFGLEQQPPPPHQQPPRGCRVGLVLRSACDGWAPGGRVKSLEGVKAGNPAVPHAQKIPPLAEIQMARVSPSRGGAKTGQRAKP